MLKHRKYFLGNGPKRMYQITLDCYLYARRDIKSNVGFLTDSATQHEDKKTSKVVESLREIAIICLLILTPGFSRLTYAHAVVTETTLEITPIVPEQPAQVSLQFNSHIELRLSQVFLVSTGDKLTNLTVSPGSKAGEIILDIPALTVGKYAIKLKIFAADGHLTEDVIHFTVVR